MTKKKEKTTTVLDLPVSFGNVSIGDTTARLSVSVERPFLPLLEAGEHLCGRRLTGQVVARANGAESDQPLLPGLEDLDHQLSGIFDVSAFRCSPKLIAFGLTFALNGLDLSVLAHFAKRNGKLVVSEVSDLPEGKDDGDEE